MLQIKLATGVDAPDLVESLNLALSQIKSEKPTIKYDWDKLIAVIEYEIQEVWKKRLCSECALWDDSDSTTSLSGFCTLTGKRMRYNCHACQQYKDVRE